MQISQQQIDLVNRQIDVLVSSGSFYGKKLSEAGITGGTPDLSQMDYIRIYHLAVSKDLTIKLDDIYFYQE